MLRETSSPSKQFVLRVDEAKRTWTILKDGKETASGKLRDQIGCHHTTGYIPDSGAWFAVWQTAYNYDCAKNTPLAVYLADGTLVRLFQLFDLFPQEDLADDLRDAEQIVCPPHLRLSISIEMNELGLTLKRKGKSKFVAAIHEGIVARMACDATAEQVDAWVEQLDDDSPDVREQATMALRLCVLKHGDRLRKIEHLVADLALWRAMEKQIRANPELLRSLPKSDARDALIRRLIP